MAYGWNALSCDPLMHYMLAWNWSAEILKKITIVSQSYKDHLKSKQMNKQSKTIYWTWSAWLFVHIWMHFYAESE